MQLSFQALVLAALSLECALAQPAHQHLHKHRRDLADVLSQKRQYDTSGVQWGKMDWDAICANGACAPGGANNGAAAAAGHPAASASAPATSASVAAAVVDEKVATPAKSSPAVQSSSSSSSSSSGSSGSCSDLSDVWITGDTSRSNMVYMGDGSACKGGCTSADGAKYTELGGSTTPRNVGQTDAYIGNVGSPYGHNMLPLTDCDVSGYDYSLTFTNAGSSQIVVDLWNKNGDDNNMPNRPLTGASRNAFHHFKLNAGQSAAFAIAENSQVAFSQACDRNSATGQHDCTWGEADFADANTPNDGASGYDRSSIPNGAGNTGLLTVSADGYDASSQTSHSFVSTSQLNTGGNTNIPAGQPAHIKVTMG
ncbi:hypothetical protein P7C71_g64, partial [Lecanoromycetidae sp. Uapishka_2]